MGIRFRATKNMAVLGCLRQKWLRACRAGALSSARPRGGCAVRDPRVFPRVGVAAKPERRCRPVLFPAGGLPGLGWRGGPGERPEFRFFLAFGCHLAGKRRFGVSGGSPGPAPHPRAAARQEGIAANAPAPLLGGRDAKQSRPGVRANQGVCAGHPEGECCSPACQRARSAPSHTARAPSHASLLAFELHLAPHPCLNSSVGIPTLSPVVLTWAGTGSLPLHSWYYLPLPINTIIPLYLPLSHRPCFPTPDLGLISSLYLPFSQDLFSLPVQPACSHQLLHFPILTLADVSSSCPLQSPEPSVPTLPFQLKTFPVIVSCAVALRWYKSKAHHIASVHINPFLYPSLQRPFPMPLT